MRTLTSGLEQHLAGQATTMCAAWRVTRVDGSVFGFTDHDHDLEFGGTVYSGRSGFSASETESELGLGAGSADALGAFSDAAMTAAALAEGRFDGAKVEHFALNWANPADHVLLNVCELGDVTRTGEAFRAELRGRTQRLEAVKGRFYSRRCDADLGDQRCGVDLMAGAYRAEGAVASAEGRNSAVVSGLGGFAAGWFRQGLIHWTEGANAGLAVEVLDHLEDQGSVRLTFWTPLSNAPEAGDAFTVTAGCDKRFETCRAKFANPLNFRGFPHLPGSDFAYGYADGDSVHDGRPVVL